MNFDVVQKHPIATVGVVAAGCILLFLLVSSGGGGSAATTSSSAGVDPNAALQAATSLQAAEIKSADDQATAQLAYKGNQDQLTAAENIAQLTTNAGLLATYNNNDTAYKVAGISAGVQNHQIDATTTQQLAQYQQVSDVAAISAGVNLASIGANRDVSIAQTTALADAQKYTAELGAQTEQLLSTNFANINASNQKAATAQSAIKTGGGILSSLLGAFF
jgi:hypothetical protein